MKRNRIRMGMVSLVLAGILAACSGAETMYIQPASLSREEQDILQLFGENGAANVYDFVVDENVQSLGISQYHLENGAWVQDVGGPGLAFTDTKGRIALDYDKIAEGFAEARQSKNEFGRTSIKRELDPKLQDVSGIVTTRLSEKTQIAYEKEIPLAVQIMTSQNEIRTFGITAEDVQAPEKYEKQGFEAVYLITVRFSTEKVQ